MEKLNKSLVKMFRFAYECRDILRELKLQAEKVDVRLILEKEMLTQREAAIYMDVKQGRITNMINGKEVSVYRPTANLTYIARKDLDAYMRRKRYNSIYEIEAEANDYVRKK